jgi:hypothetical protein
MEATSMVTPVSARLDEEIASETAERVRRERIARQSAAVGAYVAESDEAGAFYEDWGTPRSGEGI